MAYKIVFFLYQTHSQFASALLGTGGRTKMDEFAQKTMFKGPKSVTSILGLKMSLTYTYRQGCTNRCSLAAGLRGNEQRMRKWRGNGEEMEREWGKLEKNFLILSLYPPSLSISYIKICHILSQNVKYGIFVANVTKTEHTRYEEIILGRILCEEAPQVVSA